MFQATRLLILSSAAALAATTAVAQDVISAKSGLVHYVEGDVSVNGSPVSGKAGSFTEIKKDKEITTTLGRAEVLLTPGVFLRVGEQSSVRMLNSALSDTRLEILSGNSMLESDTPMKDNLVTVLYKNYATTFPKHGIFEFQTEPAQLRVYSGEAQVTAGGQTVTVKEGRTLVFSAALAQERFDPKQGDSLYRWSKTRSEYISVANVSAARSAQNSGYGSSFAPGMGSLGRWFYSSNYGMYTYLPMSGTYYSPFGFAFFSPYTVYRAYQPNYYYSRGNTVGGGGGGYTRAASSTPMLTPVRSSGPSPMRGSASIGSSGVGGMGGGSRTPSPRSK